MKRKKENSKVIRYRKPFYLNISLIVFLFIFLYLLYSLFQYFTEDKVRIYNVGAVTTLSSDTTYRGLIVRTEEVTTAEKDGYVNFYIQADTRAAVSDIVYSLDETGDFTELLTTVDDSESGLTSEMLAEFQDQLAAFTASYDGMSFYKVYDLKYDLEDALLAEITSGSTEYLESLGIDTDFFHTIATVSSGIIEYYTDGYESFEVSDVTSDDFDESQYTKTYVRSGDKVSAGDIVYKTITSETWSILIELDEETAEEYADTSSVSVEFPEKSLSTIVNFEIITGADENLYGRLSLSRYMIQYADQRYLDITLVQDQESGLKIPKTAVTTNTFYAVPLEYVTTGGNSSSNGFNQQTYADDGTSSVEFITPTICYEDDEYAYVSMSEIENGTVLVMPDSTETFTVGTTESFQGVYNVNRGYTVFKIINILDENEDYYIVAEGEDYGLTVYDQILLDGSQAEAGDLIY